MHTLYFVKLKAENSKEARRKAYNLLEENNFATDSQGFYGSSKADWYVVGGRWSGLFTDKKETEELIKPLLEKELKERPDLLNYLYINDHSVSKELKEQIDTISIKKTGLPYFRCTYDNDGYEDDAVLITKEILEKLTSEQYNNTEIADVNEDEYIEEEYTCDKLTDESIGDWLVIIDYHN